MTQKYSKMPKTHFEAVITDSSTFWCQLLAQQQQLQREQQTVISVYVNMAVLLGEWTAIFQSV
jgi:hypothetical protein